MTLVASKFVRELPKKREPAKSGLANSIFKNLLLASVWPATLSMRVFSSPFDERAICGGCYSILGNLVKERDDGVPFHNPVRGVADNPSRFVGSCFVSAARQGVSRVLFVRLSCFCKKTSLL
jgi:hypothetical protein